MVMQGGWVLLAEGWMKYLLIDAVGLSEGAVWRRQNARPREPDFSNLNSNVLETGPFLWQIWYTIM